MTPAPFCADPAARLAFDAWAKRLSALGIELSEPDLFLVGCLASREAVLTKLRAEVATATGDALVRATAAEDRACRAFLAVLDRCEREFTPRLAEAELELPVAVGGGSAAVSGARVIAFGSAEDRVKTRIVDALAGGVRLDKTALRTAVPGANGAFLRALKGLVTGGQIAVDGRGTRGFPRRYFLRGR